MYVWSVSKPAGPLVYAQPWPARVTGGAFTLLLLCSSFARSIWFGGGSSLAEIAHITSFVSLSVSNHLKRLRLDGVVVGYLPGLPGL